MSVAHEPTNHRLVVASLSRSHDPFRNPPAQCDLSHTLPDDRDAIGVAKLLGQLQCCPVVSLMDRRVRAHQQQEEHHIEVIADYRTHQRSPAIEFLAVRIRAVPEQQIDNVQVALLGGGHQRGEAQVVLRVDLRAVQQKRVGHPLSPIGCSKKQRPKAVAVLLVDSCSAPQQRLNQSLVASRGRGQQQRHKVGGALPEGRINSPAAVEPRHHRLLIASLSRSRDIQRNQPAALCNVLFDGLDASAVALVLGHLKCRLTIDVPRLNLRAQVQQLGHDVGLVVVGGDHQRSRASNATQVVQPHIH